MLATTQLSSTPSRADRTLALYAEGTRILHACHHGNVLARHAATVKNQLPAGPVELIATTVEGAGVAAVVAAARSDGTQWRQVRLTVPQDWTDAPVYVVEPLQLSEGFRRTLLRRFPNARFLKSVLSGAGGRFHDADLAAASAAAAA